MSTWKLSIKPDSESGFNAFNLCRDKSLLGVGWSAAYLESQPDTLEEAKSLVIKRFSKWPYAVRKLLEEVKCGDHVWLHQQGHYYLCRAQEEIVIGCEIDEQFSRFDLGHARKAQWVKVPEIFVSGAVQRGTIAQRMIQRIKVNSKERNCNDIIFERLFADPDWCPEIDTKVLSSKLNEIDMYLLFSIMTPDEVEDAVSMYLQTQGWCLVKSTCFRSKPTFEFSMVNKRSEVCSVQVKSGKYPDPLPPKQYERFVTDTTKVVLFSTNPNAYPGEPQVGVKCLDHSVLFSWLVNNVWSMTESLKLKLWIHLCEEG
ncbi:TPA: hypothetical protein NKQ06_004543 [Vibrio parahaemolyticus]|nr:hypothetical protein [Vibrio alginolyticus]HCH1199041.1 hypothetical protein [Vibrio parahaemolyticus]